MATPPGPARQPEADQPDAAQVGTDEKINGVLGPLSQGPGAWWAGSGSYIAWGIPAVVLGVLVFFLLTDRPSQARWLEDDEREALENELAREKARPPVQRHT